MTIRISPNTGRPIRFKGADGSDTNWVRVTDLYTDKEEEGLTPEEWLSAKRLTEMEVLAWSVK